MHPAREVSAFSVCGIALFLMMLEALAEHHRNTAYSQMHLPF